MKVILVAYASRYGSTAEVAEAIAERLRRRGETVEVRPAEEVRDLSPYRAAVVGSAVRMGRWMPAAIKLVEQHADELRRMPVAFFSVHFLALDDSEESRRKRAAYTEPVRKLLVPQQEAFFAGKIDSKRMALGDRMITKMVRVPEGDLRGWEAINAWADLLFRD